MLHSRIILTSLCVLFALAAVQTRAQPDYHRTVIVDPTSTGFANFNTIQSAINTGVPDFPTERWTVLIYSGVYTETVTLGNRKGNVNLVGVDPDAVIIQPPLGFDGIVIDGVGERNNTIRNLTIHIRDETGTGDNLDGILIKRTLSGTDPSDVTIENVTINLDADSSRAIRAVVPVSNVAITGITIDCTAHAGSGIVFDDTVSHVILSDSTITMSVGDAVLFGGGIVGDRPASTLLRGLTLQTDGENPVRVVGSAEGLSVLYSIHITADRVADLVVRAAK